ncbi:MAG TPA: RHS repeat-associated core domain-containing protein [Terriglobia bacterium]|nr:RHS repeat-associated core domain-containing protein [Terriglobia bacterium]
MLSVQASHFTALDDNNNPVTCTDLNNFVMQDTVGNRHNLGLTYYSANNACSLAGEEGPITTAQNGSILATTTTGLWFGGVLPVTVTDADGMSYNFPYYRSTPQIGCDSQCPATAYPPSSIIDRNGNTMQISISSLPGNTMLSYTDTIGRNVLNIPTFGASPDAVNVSSFSYPYYVSWTPVQADFTINLTNLPNTSTCTGPGSQPSINAIATIFLPNQGGYTSANQQKYTFTYDPVYGLISKITYPTGGYIRYVWGANPQSEVGQWTVALSNGYSSCAYYYDTPAVLHRYVSYDGQHEVLQQDFSYSTTWGVAGSPYYWSQKTTTVTTHDLARDPSGATSFKTIYTYGPSGDDYQPNTGLQPEIPVETSIQYYDTNGVLLKEVNEQWSNDRLKTQQVTTLHTSGSNLVSEIDWKYNSNEMETEEDDYDFGPSAHGALLRTESAPSYHAFATHIVDKPDDVQILNGQSFLSGTGYTYDSVGNALTTSQWLTANGASALTTMHSYDSYGNKTSDTDPKNNVTNYYYTDQFVDTCSYISPADTYLTQIVRPTTNGIGHVENFKYHCATGYLAQAFDENNNETIYTYNDPWNRITATTYPDGGHTSVSYNDTAPNPSVTTTRLMNSDGAQVVNTSTMDGMGHVVETALNSDPSGADYTATTYDGLGHVWTVSNPYRGSSPPAGTIITFTYDALDRKVLEKEQDGSLLQWCYDGIKTVQANCSANLSSQTAYPWVDVYDENGLHWQQVSDGLDRLTAVVEPNPGTGSPLETDYSYDALDNLLRVDQWGGPYGSSGDRVRTFAYDSLSRLVGSNNPENASAQSPASLTCPGVSGTWTMCYGYDANGNVLSRTDNRNITTSYSYDALNRLTSKTYTDGTPTAHFNYDESTVTVGVAGSNQHSGPYTLQNTIGRLSSEYTGASEPGIAMKAFSYDPMGRPTASPECGGNGCSFIYGTREPSQMYDLAGDVILFDLGTDQQLNYTYDSAGRVTSLSTTANGNTTPLINGISYTPWGAVSARNGMESWTYDNRMRLTNHTQLDGANLSVIGFSQALQYYPNSTLEASTETVRSTSWTWQYQYDSLNRLYTAVAPTLQEGCIETYDNWGNRVAQAPSGGTAYTCPSFTGASNTNNQIVGQNYDAAGNMLQDISGNVYTYDAEGRITSITSEGNPTYYTYRADGLRATKQAGASATQTYYTYGFDNSLAARYLIGPGATDGGEVENQEVWLNGQHLGTIPGVSSSGAFARSAVDQVGSERLSTDPSGNIYAARRSFPFGDGLTTFLGPGTTTLYFTGKERDQESGNDYFGARYYASSMGRFLSPDTGADLDALPYATFEDPQTLNLYSYVRNNPLSITDPDGHNVRVCADNGSGGQNCVDMSDDAYQNLLKQQQGQQGINLPGGSMPNGSITCGGQVCGSAQFYEPGLEDETGGELMGLAGGKAAQFAIPKVASWVGSLFGKADSEAASEAATVVGRKRFPINVAPGTNEGTTIGGRFYSGHALDQMQGRGLVPSVVEDTISTGSKTMGNTPGTTVYTTSQAKVVLNSQGNVITAIPQSK